jgi:hypothetical protein
VAFRRPSAYLHQKLARPLPIKDAAPCKLSRMRFAYMTAPPPHLVCRKHWQRAGELILARADVAEVSRQPELALFYDAKLTLRRSPNGGDLLMRINMWIVLAVLLALFAITRYVVDGEHMGDMCAHNPTAAGCEPR